MGSLSLFGLYILIARHLSIYEFGLWSVSIAIVTALSSLVGLGLPGLLLKLSSKTNDKIFRWIPGAKLFIFFSASIVILVLLGWSLFGPHSSLMTNLLLILAPYMLSQFIIDLINSKLQVEKSFIYLSLWQFFPHFFRFICVLILVNFPMYFNVIIVAYVYTLSAIVSIVIGFFMLYGLDCDRKSLKEVGKYNVFTVAREAWPFGVSAILYFIYFQSDIIILEYLVGEEAAATYNIVFIIMLAIYLIPSVISQKYLLSKIHYLSYNRPELLKKYYYDNIVKAFIAGLIISIIMWNIVPYLVPFLFGDQYHKVIYLVFVLLTAVPMRFVSIYAGIILTTKNHIRNKIKFMSVVALFNVIFNFLLIPIYRELGAAMVTVMSEVILMNLYVFYVKKHAF